MAVLLYVRAAAVAASYVAEVARVSISLPLSFATVKPSWLPTTISTHLVGEKNIG